MGIFDFLKSKQQRELEAIEADIEMLKQMSEKVFPHGAQQFTNEINAVLELLDFKYSRDQLEASYLVACRTFYLDKDNRASTVVKNIQKTSRHLISNEDAYKMHMFISAKGLPIADESDETSQNLPRTDEQRTVADNLYTIAKNAVGEIECFQGLSKKGEFEVLLFNSVYILEGHLNRHPVDYHIVQSIYWERVLLEAQYWGLKFENGVEPFLNGRLMLFLNEINLLEENRTANGLSASKKLYYCFYENPLSERPIESTNVPKILGFTRAVWHMMDAMKDKTKEF